jgi:hypothetical protein
MSLAKGFGEDLRPEYTASSGLRVMGDFLSKGENSRVRDAVRGLDIPLAGALDRRTALTYGIFG